MPHYLFKRDGDVTHLERVDAGYTQPKTVETPSGVDLPAGEGEFTTIYECDLCAEEGEESRFRRKMHFARHFNHSHTDFKESKDSWRDFVSEIRV